MDFSRISATSQSPFSRLNGRYISVTFQSANFVKNKITLNAARTRFDESKGKYANHSPTGTDKYYDEYLVFMYRTLDEKYRFSIAETPLKLC